MRISDWSSDVCSSDLHSLRRNVASLALRAKRHGRMDIIAAIGAAVNGEPPLPAPGPEGFIIPVDRRQYPRRHHPLPDPSPDLSNQVIIQELTHRQFLRR